MTVVACAKILKHSNNSASIGEWLDDNMPNPALPDTQRWTIITLKDGTVGVEFSDEQDAIIFTLRWG